jgi:hypothetical protein
VGGTGTILGGPGDDGRVYGKSLEDAEGNILLKGKAIGGPGDDTFDKIGSPCPGWCLRRPPLTNGEGPRVIRGGAGNEELRPFEEQKAYTVASRMFYRPLRSALDTIYHEPNLVPRVGNRPYISTMVISLFDCIGEHHQALLSGIRLRKDRAEKLSSFTFAADHNAHPYLTRSFDVENSIGNATPHKIRSRSCRILSAETPFLGAAERVCPV